MYLKRNQNDRLASGGRLKPSVRFGYGIGNLSFGVVMQLITSYLMFYSTNILFIPGRWVGLAASIGVVWDAISDPIMGHITDNTSSKRFGRRHLYMIIGVVGTAAVNLVLWSIGRELSAVMKFMLLAASLLMLRTFTTIFAIPYNALGAELTHDYFERTSVQSYKSAFFLLGMVFPTVGGMLLFFRPTAEYPVGQMNPNAYVYIGVVGSLIMLLAGAYCIFATFKYRTFLPNNNARLRLKRMAISLALTFRNRDFLMVSLGYLLVNFASAWVGSLALHTFTFTLGYSNRLIALVFGVMFAFAIASQPLWVYLSKRLDKKPALLIAVGFGILGALLMLFAVTLALDWLRSSWYSMLPPIALVGLGMGGMLSIPPSMVSDIAEAQYVKTGRRMEGLLFGSFTLCYKLSQSISVLVLGIMLDVIHFHANLSVQAPETIFWLGVLLPLGCVVAFVLGFFAYRHYSLTYETIKKQK